MSRENYCNAVSGLLSGAVTSTGATSIPVVDSSQFPAGNFTVKCDAEIMLVTNNNTGTNTFTVTRGQEGTTATTHATSAVIFATVTAASLQRLARQSHGGTLVSERRELNFIDATGVTWTLTDDATNNKVDIQASASGGGGGGGGGGGEHSYTTPPNFAAYTWVILHAGISDTFSKRWNFSVMSVFS